MIKYFRFSYDYVLWNISLQNVYMLLATIPDYSFDSDPNAPKGTRTELTDDQKLLQAVFKKAVF